MLDVDTGLDLSASRFHLVRNHATIVSRCLSIDSFTKASKEAKL
jgi:hypothetical protein